MRNAANGTAFAVPAREGHIEEEKDIYEMMRRKAKGLEQELTEFAAALVRTPSRTLDEGNVAALVDEAMRRLGYDEVSRDDYGNVVGVIFGRESKPTLLLNSHMDTAPAGDLSEWTMDPHSAVVADGRLHGLGAADCKGGLAAQVYAGALLKRALLPFRGNLVVAATVGQEEGHSLGVRKLMQETLPAMEIKPSYAILGDPTDLGLYYGHDGWVELEIYVEGPDPFQIDDAADAVCELIVGHCGSAPRWSREPETLSLRGLHFQEAHGRKRAVLSVERRLLEAEPVEAAINELKQAASMAAKIAGGAGVGVEIRQGTRTCYTGRITEVRHITSAWSINPYDPLVERARDALRAAGVAARVGRWRLGRLGMGTAGDVFVNDFATPAIGYGPGNEEVCHRPNEYLEISKLAGALYGTAVIAQSLIGYPVFGWTSEDI